MKKKTAKVDAIIIIVLCLIVVWIIAAVMITKKPANGTGDEKSAPAQISDYNGKRLGIVTGSALEQPTFEHFPDSQYFYYDNISDMIMALQQNKIDGFVEDEPVLRMVSAEQPDIGYFKDCLRDDIYSFGFQKTGDRSAKLLSQFNEMLAEMNKDGSLEELKNKWFSGDPNNITIDRSGLTGENGKINVAVNPTSVPFSMVSNGELNGYAVELMTMFCRKYGYDCKYDQVNTASGLAGLSSGLYDIFAYNTTVTPERAENIAFSDPIYNGGIVLAVRASELGRENSMPTIKDYNGKPVGIITGSNYEPPTFENFPDSEYYYFNSVADIGTALKKNKIDSFLCDEPSVRILHNEQPEISALPGMVTNDSYAFGFRKNDEKGTKLCNQFNEMLADLTADGSLEKMKEKWFGNDESVKVLDTTGYSGGNGSVNVIINVTEVPFVYLKDNEPVGFAMELVDTFCRRYGYIPDYEDADFNSRITGLVSGKYDIAASAMTITDERKESVNFSEPFYEGGLVLAVRTSDIHPEEAAASDKSPNIFQMIAESFEKNFIREDRWKLILSGVGTTALITVLSTLFGTLLGFLICLFRRTGSKLANVISDLYVKLLQGTPMVVLLMILYYVVFGKSGLEAVWVAIIGFTLNFGAYASEIMRSGIESIDGGQREAALALGYRENQAFFMFIFPQALVRFLPVYKQEIISLLKGTSIVGYIAIQDLTKMSDIIRSRTYEAFFPLIATAIIYFILAWIISIILKFILNRVDFRRKKRGAAK